jgi:hypothetical protein
MNLPPCPYLTLSLASSCRPKIATDFAPLSSPFPRDSLPDLRLYVVRQGGSRDIGE